MDWFQSEANLKAHWKLSLLSKNLGITTRDAIGLLHLLWEYTCLYADDGDLTEKRDHAIASYLDWPIEESGQLIQALVDSEFIEQSEEHRIVHNWRVRHRRVYEQRERSRANRKQTKGDRLDEAVVQSMQVPLKKNTAPVKRKPDAQWISTTFDNFWEVYDKKSGKLKCFAKWKLLVEKKGQAFAEKIVHAAGEYKRRCDEAGREAKHRKDPLTWLNGECWNDDLDTIFGKPNSERPRETRWDKQEFHDRQAKIREIWDKRKREAKAQDKPEPPAPKELDAEWTPASALEFKIRKDVGQVPY